MCDASCPIAKNLHLDMAGARDEFLDIDVAASKCGLRFGLTALVGGLDLLGLENSAGAAAATAGERLDDHRAALQAREELLRLLERDRVIESADHRDVGLARGLARLRLVAEQVEMLDVGADENQAGVRASAREVATLGKEAVPRVDSIAAGGLRRVNHGVHVQIGRRALAGERLDFVGDAQVQAARIILGVNGNRRQRHVCGGACDPDRDFAAVGDQQFRDLHRASSVHGKTHNQI